MLSRILTLTLLLTPLTAWPTSNQQIDLTHDYSASSQHWPDSSGFKITNTYIEKKPYIAVNDYSSNEHAGTHVDAPNHFVPGQSGIDKVPLTKLIGAAIQVDVRNKTGNDPDYLITINDFTNWEKIHGKIPADTIVLLNTGYGDYWSNPAKYSGIKQPDKTMHFPGLDPKAAEWLISQRSIKAVGIDTFSIDTGKTMTFESHQILTKNSVPIFENVASMSELPAKQFTIYALPMKIKGGTGAPVRIIAIL